MIEKNPTDWEEKDIQELISTGVEESLHLDYKSMDALGKTDGKKKEISKDVSAFANSDGGVIIYGVKEYDSPDKRHLPESVETGYDPANISKEWLEQVINSQIEPRIRGLIIRPIRLANNNYIYVVIIPKSLTAHQASDLRYYRRYNFESIAMKDYEILDIRNRGTKTILQPEFFVRFQSNNEFALHINLVNKGASVAHHFMIVISLPKSIVKNSVGSSRNQEEDKNLILPAGRTMAITHSQYSYRKPSNEIVIFPQEAYEIIPSSPKRFIICENNTQNQYEYMFGDLYWKLFADDASPLEGQTRIYNIERM